MIVMLRCLNYENKSRSAKILLGFQPTYISMYMHMEKPDLPDPVIE